MKIEDVRVTSVAVPLAAARVHSLGVTAAVRRYIVEIETDHGVGLGETGTRSSRDDLLATGAKIIGHDPYSAMSVVSRSVEDRFAALSRRSGIAAIEMALLDLQGQMSGRPICDLLGPSIRHDLTTTAYLFGREGDGRSDTIQNMGDEAETLVGRHGFGTLKIKGGSLTWMDDVAVALAMRDRFPNHKIRLDPNAVWSLPNALRASNRLVDADLEWLEDPTAGTAAMAAVAARTPIPLATNMCLTWFGELADAVRQHSTDVVLVDPWFCGGLRAALSFAQACSALGMGLGLHSGGGGTTELGIGTAAMLHLGAVLPAFDHAMDSRYHDQTGDVVTTPFTYGPQGELTVPDGPGLGVTLDHEQVGRFKVGGTASALDPPRRQEGMFR